MQLFIDTSDGSCFYIASFHDDGTFAGERRIHGRFPPSEKILPLIDQLRRKSGDTTDASISGIIVVSGPGGFSSLRSGIVTANALSYAYGVPAVGVQKQPGETSAHLYQRGRTMLSRRNVITPVVPHYGSEPTITKSKNR